MDATSSKKALELPDAFILGIKSQVQKGAMRPGSWEPCIDAV
jgi:hypothetical protein